MASVQEKARCVLWFHESRSVITVQRRFRLEYGRNPPSNNSIKRWYRQFEQTGSVQHRKGAGRPPVSEAIVDQVRELFTRSPGKSTRRASLELELPRSTVLKILHKHLKLHAYKIQLLHELKPNDKPRRYDFAVRLLDLEEQTINIGESNFLKKVIFSDEATFHVSGKVNRHNCRIWGTENPHNVREQERDSPKINVWCALAIDEVIGPFFFAEPTVTKEVYLDMLELFAIPQIEHRQPNVYWQQDGAPPHWGKIVRVYLNNTFPGRWIGRDGPIPWPPRSPDITPLDFFLWGYVKDRVFAKKVQDIEELKNRVREVIGSITPAMLRKTWCEVEFRLQTLRANLGEHVELV